MTAIDLDDHSSAGDTMPSREAGLEIAEFEDATVVFDPRANSVHLLDPLAAVLFDACDGVTVRADLIAEISEALAQDTSEVTDQVELAIRNFGALGLLLGIEPSAPPPCLGCRGAVAADRQR